MECWVVAFLGAERLLYDPIGFGEKVMMSRTTTNRQAYTHTKSGL